MRIEETEPRLRPLRLTVTDDDWQALSPADAKRIATLVPTARRFEETILSLDKLGLVHGPAHSSLGQEGGAGGSIAALAPTMQVGFLTPDSAISRFPKKLRKRFRIWPVKTSVILSRMEL
jgi:hypothetical protein